MSKLSKNIAATKKQSKGLQQSMADYFQALNKVRDKLDSTFDEYLKQRRQIQEKLTVAREAHDWKLYGALRKQLKEVKKASFSVLYGKNLDYKNHICAECKHHAESQTGICTEGDGDPVSRLAEEPACEKFDLKKEEE